MISFRADGHRFHLRAAAVVFRGDAVLVHRLAGDSIWSLPGGRVNAGETAQAAVVRELQEELGPQSPTGELALVLENFFSHGGEAHHEIGCTSTCRSPREAPC